MKHIFVIVLLLWCFLALAGELKAENVLKDVYDNREVVAPINSMEYSDIHSRQKRWVGLLVRGISALRGSRALSKMLKGTKPSKNKPSKAVRQYHRDGDMNDAVKLHKSLGGKPKPLPGDKVNGFTSRIGDRTFTVRDRSSSGKPVLDSIKTNSKKGKDRIRDKVVFEGKKNSGSSGKKSGGGGGGWWGKRRRRRRTIDLSELYLN